MKIYNNKKLLTISLLILFLSVPAFPKAKAAAPDWVTNYQSVYPESEYIAQKGTGKKSDISKDEALAALSFYFETTVNARRESNYKSLEQTEAGKYKRKDTQETIRETKARTSTDLKAVEFTEPYYDKKAKTWHCVAFIKREIVWNSYEPELRVSKDNFTSYYNKAVAEQEQFTKLQYLSKAIEQGWDFMDKISYAQFLSEKLTNQNYSDDLELFSSLASLLSKEKLNCSLYVVCQNDVGNQVYSAVTKVFRESGFTVTKNKNEGTYTVTVEVPFDYYKDDDILVYNSSVQISIKGKNGIVYSYSKDAPVVKVYSTTTGQKYVVEEICALLNETFNNEFNAAVSGNK